MNAVVVLGVMEVTSTGRRKKSPLLSALCSVPSAGVTPAPVKEIGVSVVMEPQQSRVASPAFPICFFPIPAVYKPSLERLCIGCGTVVDGAGTVGRFPTILSACVSLFLSCLRSSLSALEREAPRVSRHEVSSFAMCPVHYERSLEVLCTRALKKTRAPFPIKFACKKEVKSHKKTSAVKIDRRAVTLIGATRTRHYMVPNTMPNRLSI